jgi:DNA-binding transcriptional LysR family regulator
MVEPPELELRSLRVFAIVAEEMHFTRAAERLGIAQPPLSQQIKRLEDKIGYELFLRRSGTRKLELSPAGRSLLETAHRLLHETSQGVDAARRAANGEIGHLSVAFPSSMALTMVSLILKSYVARYPGVQLRIRQLATTQQIEALQAGTIDIGFLRSQRAHEHIHHETIFTEDFVAVLPSSHRLAKRAYIEVGELAQERFVLFPREIGPDHHSEILDICHASGFMPMVVQEATDWQTIAALVQAGLGVSIAPQSVTRVHLDQVAYKRLKPAKGVVAKTEVSMCWRVDSVDPLVSRFRAVAVEIAGLQAAGTRRGKK